MKLILTILFMLSIGGTYAQDSVIISASVKYDHPSVFRQLFLGKNYRTTWSVPVKMPVFRLDTTHSRIVELGGGQQTKSLKIKDSDSVDWVLRTVDKDVEKALPGFFRNTFIERIVQDMVSAAHPYAALAVADLAKKLSLSAPDPAIYYVADDAGLGPYRSLFAHSVCMLEKSEPTFDNSEAIDTEDMIDNMIRSGSRSVNDSQLLKARLLDMLVGDWDRHHEQWKWGNMGKTFYPVPRDRDQAFFFSNGLLVKMTRLFTMKHLVGFRPENRKMRHLNRKSWKFDRQLMSELDENDWLRSISEFTSTLNDQALHAAVKSMPVEVYNKDGKEIYETLVKRRNALQEDAMKYYYWLSKEVIIRGSADPETVKITTANDALQVDVINNLTSQVVYSRRFNPRITKQISLFLLDGDDKVIANNATKNKIRILLNDGSGNDQVQNNGNLTIIPNRNDPPSIAWRE